MEEKKEQTSNNFLVTALLFCLLIAIGASFYSFYLKKDFDFIVEVACDPLEEVCFQRDCSEEGSCPPNNLSIFKRFSLIAHDYKFCENEDCLAVCESGEIKCEPVECTEDLELGESCSSPLESHQDE